MIRFRLVLVIVADPNNHQLLQQEEIWWPAFVFDNYQELSSLSTPYQLTAGNHFHDFLQASVHDPSIVQRRVAYLIGDPIPGSKRTIYAPEARSVEDLPHELVASHNRRFSDGCWLEACAEASRRINTGAAPAAPPFVPQAPPIIIELPQQMETDPPQQQQDLQPHQVAVEAAAPQAQLPLVGPAAATVAMITEPELPPPGPAPALLLAHEEGLAALPNPVVVVTAAAPIQTQVSARQILLPVSVQAPAGAKRSSQEPSILGKGFVWRHYPEVSCSMH